MSIPASESTSAPKGDCFKAAYDHLRELEDEGEGGISLCHGLITNLNGTFVHAWVEKVTDGRAYVLDVSSGNYLAKPQDRYYKVLVVKDVVRYGAEAASILMLQSRHYGPWDQRFDPWVGP